MQESNTYSVKTEIENAFLELLTKKSYSDITITDIVTQAKVARASYYRNFSCISDIIDSITDRMAKEFLNNDPLFIDSIDERKWREFLFHYFYQISYQHKTLVSVKSENLGIIMQRLNDKISQIEQNLPKNTLEEKYNCIAKHSLIGGISRKWILDGMKETPEEMVNYVMSLITLF